MRALLVMLVACAHPVAVAPPPPTPVVAPTAAELLKRLSATYAGAGSYVERGEVVERRTRSGKTETTHHTFTTAFRRAGGFRFELFEDGARDHAYLIWSPDNKEAITRWSGQPAEVDKEALAIALVEHRRAPATIADLFPALATARLLLLESTETWLPRDELGAPVPDMLHGHACWHVTVSAPQASFEMWVDRESYLLRQTRLQFREERPREPPSDVDSTVMLDPIANTTITDAQLAGPELAGVKIVVHQRAVWIGVLMQQGGTRITNVFEHSPAALAGLQVDDEIASVDGTQIASLAQLRAAVARSPIGTRVPFEIHRNGATLTIQVEIAHRPDLDDIARRELLAHPAPDFTLPAFDGTSIALATLRGKPVVLDFWATWCKPCAVTAPMLAAFHAKHPDIALVGISDEDEPEIRAHLADHPSTYPIVRDADAKVSRAYLVSGIPMVILIDKTGIVRFVGIGVDGAAQLEAELAKLPP